MGAVEATARPLDPGTAPETERGRGAGAEPHGITKGANGSFGPPFPLRVEAGSPGPRSGAKATRVFPPSASNPGDLREEGRVPGVRPSLRLRDRQEALRGRFKRKGKSRRGGVSASCLWTLLLVEVTLFRP